MPFLCIGERHCRFWYSYFFGFLPRTPPISGTARENPAVVKAVEEVAISLGNEGRILVRESGTEPLIRVMVEAGTDELCHKNVDRVVKVMEAEGLVID